MKARRCQEGSGSRKHPRLMPPAPARLTQALNDVAALTLGREGLTKSSHTSDAQSDMSDERDVGTEPATRSDTSGASACSSPKPTSVTLTSALQTIVDKAIADMQLIVANATKAFMSSCHI